MKKTIVALLAAVCQAAPFATIPAAYGAPVLKQDHRVVVHPGSWTRGHRLSPSDRRRAVPFDYTRYRLSTPPRGYQWIRIGSNFLLVGKTSGLILRVVAAR